MGKKAERMGRVFDQIIRAGMVVAGFLVLFMIFTTGYEVIVRYIGFTPPIWRLQANQYSLLWITFLATAWLLRREGHVRVEIVLGHIPPRARAVLNTITSAICALLCLGVTWVACRVVWSLHVRGVEEIGSITVPFSAVMAIVPVGSFLLFIQFIRRAGGYWRSRATGDDGEPGAKIIRPDHMN